MTRHPDAADDKPPARPPVVMLPALWAWLNSRGLHVGHAPWLDVDDMPVYLTSPKSLHEDDSVVRP